MLLHHTAAAVLASGLVALVSAISAIGIDPQDYRDANLALATKDTGPGGVTGTPTAIQMSFQGSRSDFLVANLAWQYPLSAEQGDRLDLVITFQQGFVYPGVNCYVEVVDAVNGQVYIPLPGTAMPSGAPITFTINSNTPLLTPANPASAVFSIKIKLTCDYIASPRDVAVLSARLVNLDPEPSTTTTTMSDENESTTLTIATEAPTDTDIETSITESTTFETLISIDADDEVSTRESTTLEISTSSTTLTSSTTTPDPAEEITLDMPPIVGNYRRIGCVGSNSFLSSGPEHTSEVMTIELCVAICGDRGLAGLHHSDCYCGTGDARDDFVILPLEFCGVTCSGDSEQRCGGRLPAGERRDLMLRQPSPINILLSIYTIIRAGAPISTTVTASTTSAGPPASLPTHHYPHSHPHPHPHPHPYPHPHPHPHNPGTWLPCLLGVCSIDIIILKPQLCDSGCDGETYYELQGEHWKPVRCFEGSCRGKDLCKPERCHGGYCGEYPVVEEEACNECDGGLSYRPKSCDGCGAGGDDVPTTSEGKDNENTSGFHSQHGERPNKEADGASGDSSRTDKIVGEEAGFVITSGDGVSVASLALMVLGFVPYVLLQFA